MHPCWDRVTRIRNVPYIPLCNRGREYATHAFNDNVVYIIANKPSADLARIDARVFDVVGNIVPVIPTPVSMNQVDIELAILPHGCYLILANGRSAIFCR